MKKDINCCPSPSTEERIREAARKVFLEKGFDGATSRDIAEVAGINIALTNYYFRSKEKLFISIFEEMFQLFFQGMIETMNKPVSLREKIAELINHDFQLCKDNPSLSIFIMNEIHRNPERMANSLGLMKKVHQSLFEEQLMQGIDEGLIRPIKVQHLMPIIFANVQFLFIGKAMHMKMWQMDEAAFDQFTNDQKQIIIDMITTYLFEHKQN